jgi:hypothetical protein
LQILLLNFLPLELCLAIAVVAVSKGKARQ